MTAQDKKPVVSNDGCQYPLEDCTCETSTQNQELPSLQCPFGCGNEFGPHSLETHLTMYNKTALIEKLVETIAQNKQSLPLETRYKNNQYYIDADTQEYVRQLERETIPKSKIRERIKEIKSWGLDSWDCYDDHYQMLIDELERLLGEQEEK